jgi:hypothetical protein
MLLLPGAAAAEMFVPPLDATALFEAVDATALLELPLAELFPPAIL